jgi:rod shape-determining protein MreC
MRKREHKVSYLSSEAIFAIPAMKPSKVILSLLVCVSLMLSDIYYESSSKIRGYTQDLFMPLGALVNVPVGLLVSIPDSLRTRSQLKLSLEQAEEENKKLKVINQFLEKVSKENEELNTLWTSARLNLDNYSFVRKRSISSNEFQPLLTVDISRNSNVEINDVLLSPSGLIGKIISLGLYSAEIMLLHDVRSSVPVITEKSKLHGNVRGNGIGRTGNIEYIKKTASYELGEKVYTSGIAEIFPEGIFVGEITSIDDLADSEFLKVEVSFMQSPFNQDFYLIYKNE